MKAKELVGLAYNILRAALQNDGLQAGVGINLAAVQEVGEAQSAWASLRAAGVLCHVASADHHTPLCLHGTRPCAVLR